MRKPLPSIPASFVELGPTSDITTLSVRLHTIPPIFAPYSTPFGSVIMTDLT